MKIYTLSYRKKHIKPKIRVLRPKKRFFQRPLFWIILFFALIIASILYFFLFFPKFQVSNVKIIGNENIPAGEIEKAALNYLDKKLFDAKIFDIYLKNIFIVSKKNIKKEILKSFPKIESIQIKKRIPETLILEVKERHQFAVFCQNNYNCFLIDENGVIFEKIEDISADTMVLLKEIKDKEIFLGEHIVSKDIMGIISKIQKDLENNFKIGVKEVSVLNPLIAKTSENWSIYFNPEENIDLQITKMNSLLENEIGETERKNLQYIYLQYEDRAYYK